jgi:hypothetical protein
MRITRDVIGVATGSSSFLFRGAIGIAAQVDTGGNELDLVFAITDGPILPGPADNVNQFEERALVPALSNLLDLAIGIESDNVNLRGLALATQTNRDTHDWQVHGSIRKKVII